jgi:nucleoside 2-deoxyribosyltransferase
MLIWEFAKKGILALGWCVLPTNHNPNGSEIDHHLAEKEGVADILDELHLRKIDLADEVFILNVGGYIGKGTKREIGYALMTGKPISYLEGHPAEKSKIDW